MPQLVRVLSICRRDTFFGEFGDSALLRCSVGNQIMTVSQSIKVVRTVLPLALSITGRCTFTRILRKIVSDKLVLPPNKGLILPYYASQRGYHQGDREGLITPNVWQKSI